MHNIGKMRFAPSRATVAFAVVALCALAACGSGGGTAKSGSAAKPAGKAVGGEPLKIGMIAPTGTNGYNFDPEVAAVRAAVRGLNSRGGINGHSIELVYC